MKKHIAIITIIIMLISVMSVCISLAGSYDGADAHSASMSVESGEDPIPDESTTLDANSDVEDTGNDALQEDVLAEDEEAAGIPAWVYIAGGVAVAVVLVAVIARSRTKQSKTEYKAKH